MRIITARKRILGQGNMFTGVCLSTGGCLVLGGAWSKGGVWSQGGACSRGVSGGAWSRGGAWSGGVWSQGGACSGRSGLGGGAWWRPPGRLLLRAVRILLECILVFQLCTHILPTLIFTAIFVKTVSSSSTLLWRVFRYPDLFVPFGDLTE